MKRMLKLKHIIINFLNKKFPDPTPNQSLNDDAKLVGEFVADSNNREKAILVASGIVKDFPHWFEVKHLVKKFQTEPNAIVSQLQMLSLFKLCHSRQNSKGRAVFKIILTKEDRQNVLIDRLNIIEKEREQILSEIEGDLKSK